MSTIEITAVALGVAVAYTAIAGVLYRRIGPIRADHDWWAFSATPCGALFAVAFVFHFIFCRHDQDSDLVPGATLYWPVTVVALLTFGLLRAVFLPIRAVFRLTAGRP